MFSRFTSSTTTIPSNPPPTTTPPPSLRLVCFLSFSNWARNRIEWIHLSFSNCVRERSVGQAHIYLTGRTQYALPRTIVTLSFNTESLFSLSRAILSSSSIKFSVFFLFLMIFHIRTIVIFTWNHPIFRLALVSFHAIGFLAIEMEWFHYSSRNYSLGPDTRLSSFSFSRFIKFIAVSLSPLFSLFSHDSVGISGNDSRSNVIGCTVSISCIVL